MSESRRVDWHQRYLQETAVAERLLARIADGVFTVWSFLAHIVVYPLAMSAEGGDFHLFLDAISIEAVFVSLCVGINTKLTMKREGVAQQQRDHMQHSIERLIEQDKALTEQIHLRVVRQQNPCAYRPAPESNPQPCAASPKEASPMQNLRSAKIVIGLPNAIAVALALAAGVLQVLNRTVIHLGHGSASAQWHAWIAIVLVLFASQGIDPLVGPAFKVALHLPPWAARLTTGALTAIAMAITSIPMSAAVSGVLLGVLTVAAGLGFGTSVPVPNAHRSAKKTTRTRA